MFAYLLSLVTALNNISINLILPQINYSYQDFLKFYKTHPAYIENFYNQNLELIATTKIDQKCKSKIFTTKYVDKNIISFFIRCYLENPKNYLKSSIITPYISFRVKNIKIVLKHFNNKTRYYWEKISLLKVLDKFNNEYVTWEAIYGWKIVKLKGWWLCWFATLLYQLVVKLPDIKIIERRPHSLFYYHYYNVLGLDATIFNEHDIKKDLAIQNNHYNSFFTTYWKDYKWKFKYGIKLYSLKPFNPMNYKISKIYQIDNLKCINIYFYSPSWEVTRTVKSCYRKIDN